MEELSGRTERFRQRHYVIKVADDILLAGKYTKLDTFQVGSLEYFL